jgi:hypothetical protein
MTDQPYDQEYWGPGGIDLSRWGNSCKRGAQYHVTGAPVASGTAGVVRKIFYRSEDRQGRQAAFGFRRFEIAKRRAGSARFAAGLSSLIEPSKNPARLYGFI